VKYRELVEKGYLPDYPRVAREMLAMAIERDMSPEFQARCWLQAAKAKKADAKSEQAFDAKPDSTEGQGESP
jgi:hypothetical protein